MEINTEERIIGKPGWAPMKNAAGNEIKPVIRCNCGVWCGIQIHQINSDGRGGDAIIFS